MWESVLDAIHDNAGSLPIAFPENSFVEGSSCRDADAIVFGGRWCALSVGIHDGVV